MPLVADRRPHREASTGPRRRLAWRKGTDIDQEFWPIEAFGGVSDEQFWDDLAADKPLATTAATAEVGPGTRPARSYPAARPTDADRTAVQPVVQAVAQAAVRAVQATATPSPVVTQPYPAATQPVRAAHRPTESRGRPSAAIGGPGRDEDPLTSPAYSLRPKGAVGARSYQSSNRSRDLTREQYETAYQPGSGSVGRHAVTAGYPFPWQSHSRPTQSVRAPYGDMHGYRNPVSPAEPRRANGNGSYGGPSGNGVGDGNWGSYRAYPAVNGYRGPQDPYGRH